MITPIYWINLDRRADRRAAMEAQFVHLPKNQKITRIRAIDGRAEGMTAEIACMKSHFEAIRRAYLDSEASEASGADGRSASGADGRSNSEAEGGAGADAALILEDDVVFVDHKVPTIPPCLEDWDIVQLHYICPALLEAAAKSPSPGSYILRGYLMGCACYAISRAGMRRFLDVMSTGRPDFRLNARFLPNARAEEFVYRYVPRVFCPLIPAVGIAAESESDVPSSDHAAGIASDRALRRILATRVVPSVAFKFLTLPYDVHWLDNADDFLFD